MATTKSYSDLQQSKKLAEILPIESADISYYKLKEASDDCYRILVDNEEHYDETGTLDVIPSWSLAALLNILPEYNLRRTDWYYKINHKIVVNVNDDNYASKNYDNAVDACVDMIIELHEMNLL